MKFTMTPDDYVHDITSIINKRFSADKEFSVPVLHALVQTVNDLYSDALQEMLEERDD